MGENRKIYAALLGAGTVGSGVYKLAGMQEEDICLKTGAHLEIKKILVRNPGKVREGIPQELFTDSWQEILEDPQIQIVIAESGGKSIDGDHGNRQRYDKLYFDQNVRGRYGLSGSSGYGYETGLCGSRSHSGRGRL